MPRSRAQSGVAVQKPPDCDTKAIDPGPISACAKVAFTPTPGTSSPTQFGPRIRRRYGLAAASIASCTVRPSRCFCCDSPAVMTIAARVPRSPNSWIRSGTVAGGVQITPRSGVTGTLATSGYVSTPATAGYFGFTGMIGPVKPDLSRFRITTPPMLCGLFDAPMMAMDEGLNKNSRLRTLMQHCSRLGGAV